jgi:hypothetical protein
MAGVVVWGKVVQGVPIVGSYLEMMGSVCGVSEMEIDMDMGWDG